MRHHHAVLVALHIGLGIAGENFLSAAINLVDTAIAPAGDLQGAGD